MTFASGPLTRDPVSNRASAGIVGDMSLQKNVGGQHFTFMLINAATSLVMTGATVGGFAAKDAGSQSAIGGTVTELGNGVYDYSPTAGETNGDCLGFVLSATGSVPVFAMFLTPGGLHKNIASQNIIFGLMSLSGVADPSATVSILTSKDGGAQASGGGSVTNLGNGQYRYAATQAETNGTEVSFAFTAANDIPINYSIFTVP